MFWTGRGDSTTKACVHDHGPIGWYSNCKLSGPLKDRTVSHTENEGLKRLALAFAAPRAFSPPNFLGTMLYMWLHDFAKLLESRALHALATCSEDCLWVVLELKIEHTQRNLLHFETELERVFDLCGNYQ